MQCMTGQVNLYQKTREWLGAQLEDMRLHLARPDALIQLALLGLLTGLLAGGVIVLFRVLVEYIQNLALHGQGADAFESLSLLERFGYPLLGAILLALMFRWFAKGLYVLGVARVLERMAYHQGHLSLRGFLLQFFGVAIALVGGHSVGREGAHIFLGACAGSLLGQKLELPNNAVRTLVGCGTAAGIAASFNTPLAGVIFSLEVVMMDYQLASFIPVILSAVTATVVSNAALGNAAVFSVPVMALSSLREIPLVVILGLLSGALAAGFIRLVRSIASRGKAWSIEWQMLAAGLSTALLGMWIPEIMGIGYDTINLTLVGGYGAGILLLMAGAKLIATSICSALNVPGGMIGPSFFVGATLGGGFGHIMAQWLPGLEIQPGIYAMLGMSALMGASLQAPLAALTALLELTDNPQIIMPGMLVVVVAGVTASELFGQESLFITMLKAKGLDYRQHPVIAALRRMGVASVMDKRFVRSAPEITLEQARKLLENKPRWIVIVENKEPRTLLPGIALAGYLEALQEGENLEGASGEEEEQNAALIDLNRIPGKRLELAPIQLHETLQEALEKLDKGEGEALYVRRMSAPGIWRIYGILTREQIESSYRL
ncbi:chloride channel protein [Thiolapillus brandeum]|uniref:Chloride channel protein CIC family n=1 Tax=Thiolapillus brandeum TaxID=1076588 RepID=A0A7U6JGN0_9GAMM|nr:chloride channel protein [Thiolapillus brandeum]BAO43719.1 chloride channel protein CIC family [Thiolapillus brandeum]